VTTPGARVRGIGGEIWLTAHAIRPAIGSFRGKNAA